MSLTPVGTGRRLANLSNLTEAGAVFVTVFMVFSWQGTVGKSENRCPGAPNSNGFFMIFPIKMPIWGYHFYQFRMKKCESQSDICKRTPNGRRQEEEQQQKEEQEEQQEEQQQQQHQQQKQQQQQ